MTPLHTTAKPQKTTRSLIPLVATGCIALAFGGALSFVYFQFQARDVQLAEMAQLIEGLRQTQETEVVARAETAGLLAVDTGAVGTALTNALPAAAAPTKVDVLKSLVSQAMLDAPQTQKPLMDSGQFADLALAIQGVSELAAVAGAGAYTLVAPENSSGTPRIVFADHPEKQKQLEDFLSAAAVEGFIPYTRAAQRADGSVDGGILLLDLIKESL